MKRWILLVTLMVVPLALTACNTLQGVGSDLQEGGRALNRAVR